MTRLTRQLKRVLATATEPTPIALQALYADVCRRFPIHGMDEATRQGVWRRRSQVFGAELRARGWIRPENDGV